MSEVHEPVLEQGKKKAALTQERVRELFYYREDGCLVWKARKGTAAAGDIAGCRKPRGYVHIKVDGSFYLAHRLIWMWHQGYFPEHDIDHIDRNPLNNQIRNLREASRTCNMRNTTNRSTNSSGVKGVHWFKRDKKWHAQIMANGLGYSLGDFVCFTEAVAHRLAAEQALDWEGCNSSSPAYQYMREFLNASIRRSI
jgi:hypothetical protein